MKRIVDQFSLDAKHLRELCAKATPGKWQREMWKGAPDACVFSGREWIANSSADDAAFIAAARTALPSLLDENDRLPAALREALESWSRCRESYYKGNELSPGYEWSGGRIAELLKLAGDP